MYNKPDNILDTCHVCMINLEQNPANVMHLCVCIYLSMYAFDRPANNKLQAVGGHGSKKGKGIYVCMYLNMYLVCSVCIYPSV